MSVNLMDYDAEGLAELMISYGEKPFRAKQLMKWIHQRGETDFSNMTDIAKGFREKLQAGAVVKAPGMLAEHVASDGTTKWLLDVNVGNGIETVFIPEDDRGTLCISSQVAARWSVRSAPPAARVLTAICRSVKSSASCGGPITG